MTERDVLRVRLSAGGREWLRGVALAVSTPRERPVTESEVLRACLRLATENRERVMQLVREARA